MTNFKKLIAESIERDADVYSETMSKYEHQASAYRGYHKAATKYGTMLEECLEVMSRYSHEGVTVNLNSTLEKITKELKGK